MTSIDRNGITLLWRGLALVHLKYTFIYSLGHDLHEVGDQPESTLHVFGSLKRHDP